MDLSAPDRIAEVAWDGALVAPAPAHSFRTASRGLAGERDEPVRVTLGRPEVWPVGAVFERESGKPWVPPLGDAEFWLVRLACTLHEPEGFGRRFTEAQQTLFLRPKKDGSAPGDAWAHALLPERLTAESEREWSFTLGPKLSFGEKVEVEAGEAGFKIQFKKAFPVVQSFGAGEATPYWIYRRHASFPLVGSQYVYAVVAARAGAGLRGHVALRATVETAFGLVPFLTPEEAQASTRFEVA